MQMKTKEDKLEEEIEKEIWSIKNVLNKALDALKGLKLVKNKFQVILHICGFNKNKSVIYKLKDGMVLEVPDGERNRTAILSINDIYRNKLYLYSILSPDYEVILDLGANIGVYSLYAVKQCPKAKVYSFEPDIDSFKQLQDNVFINGLNDRVFIFNTAITKDVGKVVLYKDNVSTRGSSLFRKLKDKSIVKSTNLKTIFEELNINKVNVLKMDIEGCEYEVLYNCSKEILNRIDRLLVECHDYISLNKKYNKESMKVFLKNNGFKIIGEDKLVLLCSKK